MFGGMFNQVSGLVSYLPSLILVLLAVIFGLRAISAGQRAAKSRNWPVTTGVVVMSTIQARRSRSGQSGYSTSYYPLVVYTYEVNGQPYQSQRINFAIQVGRGGTGSAQQVANQYPMGSKVQVHYDPAKPNEAVLDNSPSSNSASWGIVILFLVLAVVFYFAFGVLTNLFLSRFLG